MNQYKNALRCAQILRNICREHDNIKTLLKENGCQCLLRLIMSTSIELKLLAAGTLADIIYHATQTQTHNDALFVCTTQHLSPYMTTITDCLLQLLQTDTSKADTNICINIPTAHINNNHNNNYNNHNNNRKLVRLCLNLLHRLCKRLVIIVRNSLLNQEQLNLFVRNGLNQLKVNIQNRI
eukprot:TRINITY_DN295_c0_g1_i1.p1 TRINITY_DN295_c0_g1~~TRINITY_DN295_c0_g1_i1.p1  ORF type:complete len:181 (+),score=24.98 TRINITY_DN295_c0_g1_i1:631-1173(+)